jgi:hypothetical protein
VSEKPILFSGPMVKAILAGTKTQTRRVYKPKAPAPYEIVDQDDSGRPWPFWMDDGGDYRVVSCPYGSPRSRLWVRETWHPAARMGTQVLVEYAADESERTVEAGQNVNVDAKIARDSWVPSIFMPRWASRLTLEITDVRVQRVQEISAEDAVEEGINPSEVPGIGSDSSLVRAYADLWDSINLSRGYGWASNPWVWALTFRRIA